MRRTKPLAVLAILTVIALLIATLYSPRAAADEPMTAATPATKAPDIPLSPGEAFRLLWARTDDPQVRGSRPYIWGPSSLIPLIDEPLTGAPGSYGVKDQHTVLYWDKGRMELNDPSGPHDPWYVTSGRLVWEMVTGIQQIGMKPLAFAPRVPATVPFGDPSDAVGPLFSSFTGRLADPSLAAGQPVTQSIDRAGQVGTIDSGGVTCAVTIAETRHCIAAPFWTFLNQTGPILLQEPYGNEKATTGTIINGPLFDPFYIVTGLPISEAYWTTMTIKGKPTRVLLQLFERRTLTYTPDNSADAQVEMGNVGQQYYHWRYDARRPGESPGGLDLTTLAGLTLIWEASPGYRYLIDGLADGRYQIILQDLSDYGAYALVSLSYHAILLDTGVARWDPHDLAQTLAHEAQHVAGFDRIGVPVNANECYAFELRSFLAGQALWQDWYGPLGKPNLNTRPDPRGGVSEAALFEVWNNTMLQQLRQTPARFVQDLVAFYQYDCAGSGPGSADRFLDLSGLPAGIETRLPVAQAFATFNPTVTAAASDGTSRTTGPARYISGIAAVRARAQLASRNDTGPVRSWDWPVQTTP